MSGPLESVLQVYEEGSLIFELEAELDGVLSSIAFAENSDDLKYINNAKQELMRYYDFVQESLNMDDSVAATSNILLALYSIRKAYLHFIEENWEELSPEQRRERGNDILGSNHFLGGDVSIPLTVKISALERRTGKRLYVRPDPIFGGWEITDT